jgi:murein DD-endopeptidase MepM/ murein hydrolase activator NlpD
LASEVSSLYGLKTDPVLENAISGSFNHQQVSSSLDRLAVLRTSALTGVTSIALSSPPVKNATTADWMRMAEAPNLWPVEGMITGSFGERIDPFNGEGAFHSGIDISSSFGHPVIAPADGIVTMAETAGGYGRLVQISHSHGLSTRYGHLSAYGVTPGQRVHRGDIVGYVGLSGRSTGPHLHYEVRINNTPVNPYKYLRTTLAQSVVPMSSGL